MVNKYKKQLVGLPFYEENFKWENDLFMISINLQYKCNYQCRKCAFDKSRSLSSLSLDRKLEIINNAKELGARMLLIEGEGEPLESKGELFPLVNKAKNLNIKTVMFTNAYLLGCSTVDFLYESDASLIISLDSLNLKTYDLLTGTNQVLPMVLENLDYARKKFNNLVINENDCIKTHLAVSSLVSKPNISEMNEINQFCQPDIIHLCNTPAYEGRAISNWSLLTGEYKPIIPKEMVQIKEEFNEGPLRLCIRPDNKCANFMNGLEIAADGRVLFCSAMRQIPFSNLTNSPIKESWALKHRYIEQISNLDTPCIPRHHPDICQILYKKMRCKTK